MDTQYKSLHTFPCAQKKENRETKIKLKFDKNTKDLQPSIIGQNMQIQDLMSRKWDAIGKVIYARDNGKP